MSLDAAVTAVCEDSGAVAAIVGVGNVEAVGEGDAAVVASGVDPACCVVVAAVDPAPTDSVGFSSIAASWRAVGGLGKH